MFYFLHHILWVFIFCLNSSFALVCDTLCIICSHDDDLHKRRKICVRESCFLLLLLFFLCSSYARYIFMRSLIGTHTITLKYDYIPFDSTYIFFVATSSFFLKCLIIIKYKSSLVYFWIFFMFCKRSPEMKWNGKKILY